MKPASRCGWAALLLAGAVSAAEPPDQAGAPVAPASTPARSGALTAKLRLTRHQLTQSPTVKRIRLGDHVQALEQLARAQELYDQAELAASGGQTEGAMALVDEALRLIMAAARLVPDAAQLAEQERRQNIELREAIRTFHLLHKNLSNRLAAINAPAPEVDADMARMDAMTRQADGLLASGQEHDAHVLLQSAHLLVVSTLNKMLMSQTLVYDLKFDTPADEFQHELAQNLGLEELVPLALQQAKVPREAADLAERYVVRSRELRGTAQLQVRGGDYPAALKSIQEASRLLQSSLRLAGVAVPQSAELTR
jgi:hypothetical protein